MQREKIKKAVDPHSKLIGLGNIFEIFSQLENMALILSEFLPQMERIIEIMKFHNQITSVQIPDNGSNLQDKLAELLTIARQTNENSDFVKMVFTQEKPKKPKKKVNKAEAVNEYLRKYNRSMKL